MDGVKYYSGTAVYHKNFELNPNQIQSNADVILDLGKVGDIAEIYINDMMVETILFPDYHCNITKFVKSGVNDLEIRVTNTWNNRIAGDDLHPDKERYTFYPVKSYSPDGERRKYKESDLLDSGLMGPVIITFVDKKTNF